MNTAVITRIDIATPDVRILHLKPDTPFDYKAGQHVYLSFDDMPPRPYSIACAPDPERFEIHIKNTGGKTSTHATQNCEAGDIVTYSSPQGDNIYDGMTPFRPMLAIAGGVGITPIKAIVEHAINSDHHTHAPIHLFWGTNISSERYLDDVFLDLQAGHDNMHYHPVTGTPPVGELAADFADDFSGYDIYLAGRTEMIAATIPLLLEKNARADHIFCDNHGQIKTTEKSQRNAS